MAERQAGDDEERLLRARLDRLSDALGKRVGKPPPRGSPEGGDPSGKFGSAMGLGMRAATEFAGAVVIASLLGWQMDVWLGTKPAFLIILFMLGVAAGTWNVIRVSSPRTGGGAAVGGRQAPPPADDED